MFLYTGFAYYDLVDNYCILVIVTRISVMARLNLTYRSEYSNITDPVTVEFAQLIKDAVSMGVLYQRFFTFMPPFAKRMFIKFLHRLLALLVTCCFFGHIIWSMY